MKLFGRRYRLTIGTLQISALRVAFSVSRSLQPQPNTAEVQVWNLSESSRKTLQAAEGIPTQIEVGYEGGALETLFLGQLRSASTTREGADLVTSIGSGDSEKTLRSARVSVSIAKNSSTQDVLRKLVQALGVSPGNSQLAISRLRLAGIGDLFSGGTVLYGSASEELTRVCRSCALDWSVQNGDLQILPLRQALEGVAVKLTPSTGLIGSPTLDAKGVMRAVCLIVPDLIPGRKVVLESAELKGAYRVERVETSGDTHGQDWYHTIEARPL